MRRGFADTKVWIVSAWIAVASPVPAETPLITGSASASPASLKAAAPSTISVSENYMAGDYEAVVADLERITTFRRLDAQEWLLKGAALMRLGRASDARMAFLRAEAEDPSDLSVPLCLAEAEIVEGDYQGARARLKRPLTASKARVREYAEFLRVLIHLREDKLEEADCLAEAMRWPSVTPARLYAQAAVALVAGRLDKAEALRREAIEVFGRRATLAFDDSLVSMGWMWPTSSPIP